MITAIFEEFLYYIICYAPFITAFFITVYGCALKNERAGAAHTTGAVIFVIYILAVLCICGSATYTDIFIMPFELRGGFNAIPFRDFGLY